MKRAKKEDIAMHRTIEKFNYVFKINKWLVELDCQRLFQEELTLIFVKRVKKEE